jgi:hypothetical protein
MMLKLEHNKGFVTINIMLNKPYIHYIAVKIMNSGSRLATGLTH